MSSFEQQQAALSAATRRLAAEVASAEAAVAQSRSRRQTAEAEVALASKRAQLAAAQRESEDEALKQLVLAPLPSEHVRLVFLLLPVDARLRCREVCRGWCAFLADASLWRDCDLSARSGVVAVRTPALLRAASVMAQGTLQVLDATGWRGLFDKVGGRRDVKSRLTVLLPVLQANAGSLVELRAWECFEPSHGFYFLSVVNIEALLTAAPLLRLLECDAGAYGELSTTTLRLLEEPQFAPVRLQSLYLQSFNTPLDVPAVAARLSTHPSLTRLHLWGVDLRSELALDAVVDLAILQLQRLTMAFCNLSPASLSALTRMLGSGSLTELYIYNEDAPLVVGDSLPAFCAALRASRLVELSLEDVDFWVSLEDGLAVIAACTGHPTLRELSFQNNDLLEGGQDAAGHEAIEAALDALEAANAELHVER